MLLLWFSVWFWPRTHFIDNIHDGQGYNERHNTPNDGCQTIAMTLPPLDGRSVEDPGEREVGGHLGGVDGVVVSWCRLLLGGGGGVGRQGVRVSLVDGGLRGRGE